MDEELFKLINRAKTGEKEAFASLVKRYKETVFRFAYGMLTDRMEAEDIAQEAFIKAFYSLPKLDNSYAFSSWLTRIVSNLCYDHIQKRKKLSTISSEFIENHSADNMIEQKQLRMSLEEALFKLSPEHREVILLRDVEGYTYDEIAGILHIPLGTVKSRINAARLLLRNEMKREMED